ncbi:MAG: hypothetical protein IPP25_04035 [Saprospiraceae bacterium]|nr:hypothetical protein [Candidatus Opimibacter skivensis]
MKISLIVVLGILDIICFAAFIYLWRSSQYPGAEIGNMDWGVAKIFGIGALIISLLIAMIIYFKK